ncbi:hypothetical protein NKH57_20095 [Mesorhizobium sp. M1050]|uniref:hypothetical protein n=1 Tax=Mesorhizobium sp. M1050 TaxID=2957051 RepID=UPI0033366EB5
MFFLLWVTVIATTILLLTRFPTVSAIWIGFVGLCAYSIPALLGITRPVLSGKMSAYYAPTSDAATLVMAVAWLGFALSLFVADTSGYAQKQPTIRAIPHPVYLNRFLLAALGLVVLCYSSLAYKSGNFLWLLDPRAEISSYIGADWLLWKWSIALGFLIGWYFQVPWARNVFSCLLALIVVGADRTTPVITLVSLGFALMWGRPAIRTLFSGKSLAAAAAVLAVIFYAKPFYVSLKSDQSFSDILASTDAMSLQAGWEAFGTHELLEKVVALNVSYPLWSTTRDCLAQFLLVPSYFGFGSGGFNELLQQQVFSQATYGLASNLWAHCWAMGGLLGVLIGGGIYGASILFLNNSIVRSRGMMFFLFLLGAATIGVYAHRNSPENILALIRPIVIVFLTIQVMAILTTLQVRSRRMMPVSDSHSPTPRRP